MARTRFSCCSSVSPCWRRRRRRRGPIGRPKSPSPPVPDATDSEKPGWAAGASLASLMMMLAGSSSRCEAERAVAAAASKATSAKMLLMAMGQEGLLKEGPLVRNVIVPNLRRMGKREGWLRQEVARHLLVVGNGCQFGCSRGSELEQTRSSGAHTV